MGIPLYREKALVAPSPKVKLPAGCPYVAGSGSGISQQQRREMMEFAQYDRMMYQAREAIDGQARDPNRASHPHQQQQQITNNASATGVTRSQRNVAARSHVARERSDRPIAETSDRAAHPAGRYTQRLVRSAPGTREYEDEMRVAELVEIYFHELHRPSRHLRGQQQQQQQQDQQNQQNQLPHMQSI